LEIGALPVDAIFTPITRVSYKVENMRVGKRTDFDRLFLDIETDGTITPEQAFSSASDILVEHFSLIAGEFKPKDEKKEQIVKEDVPAGEKEKEEDGAKTEKKGKKNKKSLK